MTRTLLAACLLAAATASTPSQAETAATCDTIIAALPAVLTTRGVYCLNKDLGTSITSGAAITVHTNQVTIDCNGYRISGLGGGAGTAATGVYANARSLVTVRNCGVRGFAKGIALTGDTTLVENNHLDQNRIAGIDVRGDGNLVRGNRVFDTGASSTVVATVTGIYAENGTDVRDNVVENVLASAEPNTDVYGIYQYGGSAVHVAGNTVRYLAPSGTGAAYGIYTYLGSQVFLDDNRVSLPTTVTESIGYRCNLDLGTMRNNSEWGFTTSDLNCLDDGGNVDL
jgi:parallel beta-helix repeat protein